MEAALVELRSELNPEHYGQVAEAAALADCYRSLETVRRCWSSSSA